MRLSYLPCALFCAALFLGPDRSYSYEVHSIPAPGTNAEGLTWDGAGLWNSDIDDDMIYRLDPATGTILAAIPSPAGLVEGLAYDGSSLWASDAEGAVYQLDPADGAVVSSFPFPGWPHGMTSDGDHLWVNDFAVKRIHRVDPATGVLLDSIPAPGSSATGLTWDGEHLWTGDFTTHLLYRIDPADGTVLDTIPSPHINPRDLAWDGEFLWLASWQSGTLYQVSVGPFPSILINGSEGPVTVQAADKVVVEISMDCARVTDLLDWWFLVRTPFAPPEDWYYFDRTNGALLPGFRISHQGPCRKFPPATILRMKNMPVGRYTMYLGVDGYMNGRADPSVLRLDTFKLRVVP